ncbi:MAG: hypothetical protein NWF02_03415 [Candidatus Bathyarchaeota archaeon]|nr:hypothetical protein [Candidatus Bathyarchaeum sp.]
MQFLKHIKVRIVEKRPEDAWYDMSLRQLRTGEVTFYRVKDFLTGEWLFKLCNDKEQGKITLKAVKCPAGLLFSQLEGKTMLFQVSQIDGMLYDVISLTELDDNRKLKRNVVATMDEIPAVIKDNYEIKSYEAATGKKAPGKFLVTLHKADSEKELVTLFVLERAWGISDLSPEDALKEKQQSILAKKKAPKREIDTGHTLSCPICGKVHRLVHVETEKSVKHVLRKSN